MADNGWTENNKGWNLLNGIGCEKNEAEAIRWFELSAAKGCGTAMVNLGNIYESREDYDLAYKWYLEAAYAEDEVGMFNVANMYHWGWHVKQDYEKAWHYFQRLYAVDYEDPEICMYMGLYAEYGYVSEPDYDLAVRYYEEGMERGDAYCATNLGRMYATGTGVEKDEEKAFRLYQEALDMGDPLAYANLGYCYETGQGVPADKNKAREYYEKGAALGEENCIVRKDQLL